MQQRRRTDEVPATDLEVRRPRVWVGFDPGSRRSGVTAVDEAGVPFRTHVFRSTTGVIGMALDVADALPTFLLQLGEDGYDVVSFGVEGQHYQHKNAKGSPDQLFPVSMAAGVALGLACEAWDCHIVQVKDWKGSVPKLPNHRRLLKTLGWTWTETDTVNPYAIPDFASTCKVDGEEQVRPTEWGEVLDAAGIARWLRTEWLEDNT